MRETRDSIIVCGLYYVFWMHVLPKWRGYKMRTQTLDVDDNTGANTHRLVRVPLTELAEWDAAHDEAGRLKRRNVPSGSDESLPREKTAATTATDAKSS